MTEKPALPTNANGLVDITKVFAPLEALLYRPAGSNLSELQISMHFIQVFSQWGIRLPVKDTDFTTSVLRGKPAAGFAFFTPFSAGNKKIVDSCTTFRNKTLGEMVSVNSQMLTFTEHVTDAKGRFSILKSLLQGDKKNLQTAAKLLTKMIATARETSTLAQQAGDGLREFRTEIEKAGADLVRAKKLIDELKGVNQATIDELSDDENVASIAAFMKKIKEKNEEYEENVKVASSTPAYAWVNFPIPIGLISALIIASVFGAAADKLWQEINALMKEVTEKNETLARAYSVQGAIDGAFTAHGNVSKYALMAEQHLTNLMNGWNDVMTLLESIRDDIENTMDGSSTEDPDLALIYIEGVEDAFRELRPVLDELHAEPYISIVPEIDPEDVADAASKFEDK